MFVVFYTANIVYICVFMNWSTSNCLCDTSMDPWNVCMFVLFKLSNGLLVLLNDVSFSIQTQWEWRTFVPERFIITAWGRVLNKLLVAQLVKIVAHSVEYEVPSHIRKSQPFVHILSQMDQVRVHPSARRSCARDAFPSFQLWLFWAVRATCLVHCTMLWSAKYLASKTNCETSQSEFCPASCYFLLFQMFISPNITSW